ncbi:MAG TPA: FAD-dependent oxidoreductase [Ktedonobacteraceae bacterium]|nr:FAD-dependent oxidoreductase [Ktedonobacteraceae bacterium]
MDILVIGCGVSGLTTGLRLLQAGHTVRIWARDLPPHTTSNVAAAIWFPYKAYPIDKVTNWSKIAFQKFKELQFVEGSGILMSNVIELKLVASPDPWWATAVDGFRHAGIDELPAGYADGFVFMAPVIDTSIHLDYLMRTFLAQGGQIEQRTITGLAEAFAQSEVMLNCSGLGARQLVSDQDLHAARGQVVRIKHNSFRQVLMDEEGPNQLVYIIPRTHDIILGGRFEEHNESLVPDPEQTQAILRRCANLAPEFASIAPEDILDIYCGLRPVRSIVRVEAEQVAPDRLLLHNYGHGGAGITLSWGCAEEVVELLEKMT